MCAFRINWLPRSCLISTSDILSGSATQQPKIAVIGLGYVGLPLSVALSRHYPTCGYDINRVRVSELNQLHDSTAEVSSEALRNANNLSLSDDLNSIADADIYIVTVPTPIDGNNLPDLTTTDAGHPRRGQCATKKQCCGF